MAQLNEKPQEWADQMRFFQIAERLYGLHGLRPFAYIYVDQNWKVQEVSENLTDYGFQAIEIGSYAFDQIDFLVGLKTTESLTLPFVSSPGQQPLRVILIPSDAALTIVIADAQQEFDHHQQLQQKANENQLLLDAQARLMRELEQARMQLQDKNVLLQEATRLQTSFLSGVSHEFRTPLTSMLGYSGLLQAELDKASNPRLTKYLAAIQRSGKHLLSLVENLLDHGKYSSREMELNPKSTNIVEIFTDIVLLLEPSAIAKGIDFDLNMDVPEDILIDIDDSKLRQCLINLIGNAIKFTDQGGVVVDASWQNDTLRVGIRDTGIGIKQQHLEKITQPFWQAPGTGKGGSGLGLTITNRIIELMDGSLAVTSRLGVGSMVNFEISAPKSEAAWVVEDSAEPLGTKALNLLFVEDDQDIANLITVMLQERGVSVTHVEHGGLVAQALNRNNFDLLLLDLHMPVMDGYSVTKETRDAGNNIPIVIMSASSTEASREQAHALGCDGYLVKPVDISDLLVMARKLVA